MQTFLSSFGQIVVSGALVFAGWLGYHPLGAVVYKPLPLYESSLAVAIDNVSTSSLTLVSGVDRDGNSLSGPMCFTVDSGVANSVEFICGSASGTTVSNLLRGTDSSGVTSNASLAHSHRVGADVKITDYPYLSQYYRFLNGIDAFPNVLQYTASNTAIVVGANPANIASVGYVNSTSFAGAPNGSLLAKGIYQEATKAQSAAGNATGSTGADLIVPNAYHSATSTATTTVPVTRATGKLDPGFIDATSTNYGFANQTLSTTTLNGSTTISGALTDTATATFSGTVDLTSATVSSTLFYSTSTALSPPTGQSCNAATSWGTTSTIVSDGTQRAVINLAGGFMFSGGGSQVSGITLILFVDGSSVGSNSYSAQSVGAGAGAGWGISTITAVLGSGSHTINASLSNTGSAGCAGISSQLTGSAFLIRTR
jgi:hypothetical protein